MVGCVLVMAPTGLECTQDMRNGTGAGGGATSPRGGQASHRQRALVLQPTAATSGGVPRPYAHWMGRPRGDWVDEKRNGKEQSEQNSKPKSVHARAAAKEQKQKAGKLLSEIVHPSRKCVLSSLIRNKCDLFIIIVETVVWGRLGGGCGRVSAAQKTAAQMSACEAGVCEPGAWPFGSGGRCLFVSTGAARTINAFLKGNARGLCLLLTVEAGGPAGGRAGGGCFLRSRIRRGKGLTSAGLRK